MRDEDKPFICYKQGWNIKIAPRNAAGWRAMGLWTLALLLPTIAFVPLAIKLDDTPHEAIVLLGALPMLAATGLIVVAMIRWIMARSEVIDIEELTELKRQRDRSQKRSGR